MLSLIVRLCMFLVSLFLQAFTMVVRKVRALGRGLIAILLGLGSVMVNGRVILLELVFSFTTFLISLFVTLDTLLLTNGRLGRSTKRSLNTDTGADNDDHKYDFPGHIADAGSGPVGGRFVMLA